MTAVTVCANCRCGPTCHVGDDEGCWGRNCMRSGDRCQRYVRDEAKRPPPVTPVHRDRAEALADLRDGTMKKQMFRLLQVRGGEGYTDDEMESVLGKSHQSVSACRNSLMNDGLVVDGGERRDTRYGVPAIVWVVAR